MYVFYIIGSFYAPDGGDESVLGLCTNPTNSILVTGDTQGRVAIWGISSYCMEQQLHVRTKEIVDH